MRRILTSFLAVSFSAITSIVNAQSFTNQGVAAGVNLGGNKDGGICWADFNNDGLPDMVVNTDDNTNKSRLYFNDGDGTFTDVTATNANDLDSQKKNRSAVAGDFNKDGFMDFAVNHFNLLEVWLNQGSTSTPPYSFGTVAQAPSQSISSLTGGFNSEGLLTVDYDNDGDLDFILDNHTFGIDILTNNGSGSFTQVDNTLTGLPTGGTGGDYAAAGDFNNDGYVDMCVRRDNLADIYLNVGNGTFSTNAFDQSSSNSNKGAVCWADFDSDGDLDLFWTDNGTNQIWRNDSGTFTATGQPATSAAINLAGASIDACTAGDVDNDGDIDLFLANIHTESYLFINNNPSTLSFTRPSSPVNFGINPGGDADGASMVDYDNDGDLDIYISMSTAANQLWQNGLNNSNYLRVHAKWDLGGGNTALANGATAVLVDCSGNAISPLMTLAAGEGFGAFGNPAIHFGVADPNEQVYVRVYFPYVAGERKIVTLAVIPADDSNEVTILNTDDSDALDCPTAEPNAVDDVFTMVQGAVLNADASTNDSDAENDPIIFSNTSNPSSGVLTFNPDGTFIYTPGVNFTGVDSFEYEACDDDGCDTAMVTINVQVSCGSLYNITATTSLNSICTNEGEQAQLNIESDFPLFNIQWTPADGLSDVSIANPLATPATTTTYTVNANVTGNNLVVNPGFEDGNTGFSSSYGYVAPTDNSMFPESIYTVDDDLFNLHDGIDTDCNDLTPGEGGSGMMMVVNGSGTPNTVVWTESISVVPNTQYAFSAWLASWYPQSPADLQFKVNGDFLNALNATSTACEWNQFYSLWNSGSNNTATISIINQNTDLGGNDFLLDEISFAAYCEKSSSVTLNVQCFLSLTNDEYLVNEEDELNEDVSLNDYDPDGNGLEYTIETNVTNGTLLLNADGSCTYTPNLDFFGTDVFTYTACDDADNCATAEVTIQVLPVNDIPVAQDDNATVANNDVLNSSVAGNDTDVDGDDLIWSIVTGPTDGVITLNADGSYSYDPDDTFVGIEVITYMVCDIESTCDIATLTIVVTPADDDLDDDGITNDDEILGGSDPNDPCDPNPLALSTNDCDNDGLDIDEETTAGTDTDNPDTDGDQINDGDEVNGGSDPLDPCDPNPAAVATSDCDNDGLSAEEEDLAGTDAGDSDTDDDGINDGDEVNGGSDPLDPCDPNINALATNDCDNDGLDNDGETLAGTDNNNPDT
ncbi:MAG: Ig-like domain-containing protein, partial [Flavobacteriales bacterium]